MRVPLAFGSPSATLALLLCVPTVWIAFHSYRRLSSARRASTTAVRVVGLILLALALAGFRLQRPTDHLATVFLLDESASVSPDARRQAAAFLAQAVRAAQPGDRYAVAAFGRAPIVAAGWSADADVSALRVTTDRTATNIAEAVDVGLAMLPDDRAGRIIILSDGRETRGDAAGMAGLVRWRGASVDVVPLTAAGGVDAAVAAVDVPGIVEPGAPVPVRVELRSNAVVQATLRLFRNDVFWREEPLTLIKGSTTRVYEDVAGREGAVVYRVELEAANDAVPENGRGLGLARIATPPQVWVVSEDESGAEARDALVARGLRTVLVAPSALPDAVAGYADVRCVVLADVPAAALTHSQHGVLAAAVREFGVGLVMLGGTRSFGPGGWRGTLVEEVLPVTMESTRPREGIVGIVLVIDVSGSMAQQVEGQTRLHFARDAALSAYAIADKETLVGVVAFSSRAATVLPLEQRPRDPSSIIPTLARLRPQGGTAAAPALRMAIEHLTNSEATTRHIIFMTDGIFHDQEGVAALYPALKSARITLSTIGAGAEVNAEQLREMADATGGIFYPYTRAAALPAIFAEDTMQVIRNPVVPGPIVPVPRTAGAAIRGVNWSNAPLMDGMISTTLRDSAQMFVSSPDQDPLVASWRAGLATTGVLCTDLGGRFTPAWRDWPDRTTLLESLVRATLPPPNTATFSADLRLEGSEAVVTADAVSPTGAFVNGLQLEATVLEPTGRARVVPLRQVGPGQYEARTPLAGVGLFTAQVRDTASQNAGRQWVSAALPYPREFAPDDGGRDVLPRLADATGGQVLTEPTRAFRRPPTPQTVRTDLWPWLAAGALCLFPIDIGLRRFAGARRRPDVPRPAVRGENGVTPSRPVSRLGPTQRESVPAARRETPPAAPESSPAVAPARHSTTSRLLEAKRRARERGADDAP